MVSCSNVLINHDDLVLDRSSADEGKNMSQGDNDASVVASSNTHTQTHIVFLPFMAAGGIQVSSVQLAS